MKKKNRKLNTDIIGTIMNNSVEVYSFITQANVNDRDRDKRTAIYMSITMGYDEMTDYFLEIGADVNIADKDGFTPLHFAAIHYQVKILKRLIERGAIIDAQDSWGNTPLWRAVYESRERGEVIKILLQYGADKNLKNNFNISPLELANKIANCDVKQFFNSDL